LTFHDEKALNIENLKRIFDAIHLKRRRKKITYSLNENQKLYVWNRFEKKFHSWLSTSSSLPPLKFPPPLLIKTNDYEISKIQKHTSKSIFTIRLKNFDIQFQLKVMKNLVENMNGFYLHQKEGGFFLRIADNFQSKIRETSRIGVNDPGVRSISSFYGINALNGQVIYSLIFVSIEIVLCIYSIFLYITSLEEK
jgi:hypothetical protein